MAIDTAAKRCSSINVSCPWRGPGIVPDVAFPQGEKQAAVYLYSGILAGGAAPAITLIQRTLTGVGL